MVSERTKRRRQQRLRAELAETLAEIERSPEAKRRRRNERRRRWPPYPQPLFDRFCAAEGREKGGRPPRERRCTKRLGSRLCWGWRRPGSDRCWRHQAFACSAAEYHDDGRT